MNSAESYHFVYCPAGHPMKVLDSMASQTLSCPQCGVLLSSASLETEILENDLLPVLTAEIVTATIPKKSTNYVLLGVAIALSGLILLTLAAAVSIWMSKPIARSSYNTTINRNAPRGPIAQRPPISPEAQRAQMEEHARQLEQQARTAEMELRALSEARRLNRGPERPNQFSPSTPNMSPPPQVSEMLDPAREEAKKLQEKSERAGQRQTGYITIEMLNSFLVKMRMNQEPNAPVMPDRPDGNESYQPGKLSWRVHLLPYLGLQQLYQQFNLNEPWDSEHNLALVPKIPPLFATSHKLEGRTQFRSFLNLDGPEGSIRLDEITDGLDQTALLFLVEPEYAIPWTQPDSQSPLPPPSFEVLDPDQSSQIVSVKCDLKINRASQSTTGWLEAYVTPAGGEHLSMNQVPQSQIIKSYPKPELSDLPPAKEEAEARDRLKKVAIAVQKMVEKFKTDPSLLQQLSSSTDQLSWRVHLLPFLGEDRLYSRFHLDEPWYSPNNLPLVEEMPEFYQSRASVGRTRFVIASPSNQRAPFRFTAVKSLSDPPELTTFLYYVGPSFANTWTAPDPHYFKIDSMKRDLGWSTDRRMVAATFGGTAFIVPHKIHPSKLRALTTFEGNEKFDIRKAFAEPDKPLQVEIPVKPPTPIQGLVPIPKIEPLEKPIDPSQYESELLQEEKLRQIGLGIMRFESATKKSPLAVVKTDGSPSELSWRVHLLPFIDQRNLYEQFALDEPWDSPTNLKLAEMMPLVLQSSSSKEKTGVQVLKGKNTLFSEPQKWISKCTDGLSNTILLVQTDSAHEVTWTQPQDIPFEENFSFDSIVPAEGTLPILLGDRSCLHIDKRFPTALFQALATSNQGELVDAATIRRYVASWQNRPLFSPREQSNWNAGRLRMIAMATLNYESTFRALPPKGSNPDSPPNPESFQLSWRVHLLPFLEQQALYSQFRLSEPWDSPHNKQLIALMPDVYRSQDSAADSTMTRIVRFTGKGTCFEEPGALNTLRNIQDGISNTIHFIEAPTRIQVPWTQPLDYEIELEAKDILEKLAKLRAQGITVSLFDGVVRPLPMDLSPETFKGLITPRGGEAFQW